jgi:hypothetical protein
MSSLLHQLQAVEGKAAYQSYTVRHGIETFQVLIPVKHAQTFEKQFDALGEKQKPAIRTLVESIGGKVRG